MNKNIAGAIIVPHPPLIIPDVGRGDENTISKTVESYREAARFIRDLEPESLILISPHIVMYYNYFHICPGEEAHGSMREFRAPSARLTAKYDSELRSAIIREAKAMELPAGIQGERDPELDHASFIPLWFLEKEGVRVPIVRIGLSGMSAKEHYKLGLAIQKAVQKTGRRVAVVASGDLSHKLKTDGPYGFAPEGPEFDSQVTKAMDQGDFMRFLTFDETFSERSANCGLKSFQIMAGILDGLSVDSKLLSYEGPFGVGYAVAEFKVTGTDEKRCYLPSLEKFEDRRIKARRASEDPYVRLARLSIESYVNTGSVLKKIPEDLPEEMFSRRAGVFVSLHEFGQLRGCIGTISAVTSSVAREIISNAVSACSRDPRFSPVRPDELKNLTISVDVLGPTEPVSDPSELDVKRYGVIVSCGDRRGLLLPNLEGVDDIDQQISIARQKGGIRVDEDYTLERFEVVRHF